MRVWDPRTSSGSGSEQPVWSAGTTFYAWLSGRRNGRPLFVGPPGLDPGRAGEECGRTLARRWKAPYATICKASPWQTSPGRARPVSPVSPCSRFSEGRCWERQGAWSPGNLFGRRKTRMEWIPCSVSRSTCTGTSDLRTALVPGLGRAWIILFPCGGFGATEAARNAGEGPATAGKTWPVMRSRSALRLVHAVPPSAGSRLPPKPSR